MNDGSRIRLRAERPNHVCRYAFVSVRDAVGRSMRLLTRIDAYTRQCLAIHGARSIGAEQVMRHWSMSCWSTGLPNTFARTMGDIWLHGLASCVDTLHRRSLQALWDQPARRILSAYAAHLWGSVRPGSDHANRVTAPHDSVRYLGNGGLVADRDYLDKLPSPDCRPIWMRDRNRGVGTSLG